MKSKKSILIVVIAAVVVGVGGFLLMPRKPHPPIPVVESAHAPKELESIQAESTPIAATPVVPAEDLSVTQLDAAVTTAPSAVQAPTPVGSDALEADDAENRELYATRLMVAAHAPLRVPSVADPDSVENQRVLQTMVFKALSRRPEGSPASTSTGDAETVIESQPPSPASP